MKQVNGVSFYDTLEELADPKHTALLVVDVQNDFCHPDGKFGKHGKDLSQVLETLPRVKSFVNESQQMGIRTFFIRQTTQPGGRSDSPAWLRFKTRDGKSPEYTLHGSWGWQNVDGLAPGPEDLVVEKYRSDAFVHTNLDQLLRANGIETVVVLGFITEGCVESTIRSASYHDYYVIVVQDCVNSPNKQLHEGSMRLLEARYPLARAEDILDLWRGQADRATRVSGP